MITTTQNKQIKQIIKFKEECKRKKKTRIISCRGNSYVYRDPRRIFI